VNSEENLVSWDNMDAVKLGGKKKLKNCTYNITPIWGYINNPIWKNPFLLSSRLEVNFFSLSIPVK